MRHAVPESRNNFVNEAAHFSGGEFMGQAVNLVVYAVIYAGVLCLQFSLVERRLRRAAGSATEARVVLPFLHGALGLVMFFGVELLLNAMLLGDYRQGVFGWYSNLIPVGGALVAIAVPWLPLMWQK
jgi:hypothetical protein